VTVDDVVHNRDAWNRISATEVPLPDASFDPVFCDHGGLTWADLYDTVAEAARLLRAGGLLVFNSEWIRLLRANGFDSEALLELCPAEGATTTYEGWVPLEWARRWPSENIWKVRKRG